MLSPADIWIPVVVTAAMIALACSGDSLDDARAFANNRLREGISMHTYWAALRIALYARFESLRRNPEAGYTTETVLVTALLVVAAIAIIAILVGKVIAKANGISL